MIALARFALAMLLVAVLGTPEPAVALRDYRQLHSIQWELFHAPQRHRFALWGRGTGKDHAAFAITLDALGKAGPGWEGYYVGPSHQQVKRIAWKKIKSAIPKKFIANKNETDLTLTMTWGASLQLLGSDNVDSVRGVDMNLLVITEFAFCHAELLNAVEGGLRTQADRMVIITTPDGPNHAHDHWRRIEGDPEWFRSQHPTWANPFHDAIGLEARRLRLARPVFDQEYGAQFEARTGAIYCDLMLRDVANGGHLSAVELDPAHQVLIGQDFNAGHYCAKLAQRRGDSLLITDEITTRTTLYDHRDRLATFLRSKGIDYRANDYRGQPRVVVCTDASGDFNATSRITADANILRAAGFRTRHDTQNPPVIDRIHAVQSLLRSGDGRARLFVNPRCQELLHAMQNQRWDGWGKPEKKNGWDDDNDALGYVVWDQFPIRDKSFAKAI